MVASTAADAPARRLVDAPTPPAPPPKGRRLSLPWRTRLVDPNDPRYPRKRWRKWVRRALEYVWIAFGVYAGIVFSNVIGVLASPNPVTPQAIFGALLLGRLYEPLRHDVVAAGIVAYVILALVFVVLALLIMAALRARNDARREKAVMALRKEYERLAPYYKVKPVARLDPDRGDVQLAKYVAGVYLARRVAGRPPDAPTSADEVARAALRGARDASSDAPDTPDTPLGILVSGRPTLGKTRCAFEAMRAVLGDATFVAWPHGDAPAFDFALVAGKTVVLWLDNLQEYANDREAPALKELPGKFAGARLVIVATSRDGEDFDRVDGTLSSLTRRLRAIALDDITPGETEELAEELEHEGVVVDRKAEDGTPGALLLDVQGMIERYRAPSFAADARDILKAMKLLRAAGIYEYPAARVRAVAGALFALPDTLGAWQNAVNVLVRQDFVRLGPVDERDHLNALAPRADVYLERAVPDYPTDGRQLSDDWPALCDALERTRDTGALFKLGYTLTELSSGLDPAQPWNLLATRRLAERCWRAYLALSPPDDAGRAGAQNNLGNTLADQAELATTEAARRELLAQAVAAHTAALGASAAGTSLWAQAQNNLGLALADQAERATTEAERGELLARAVAASTAALGASAAGTSLWALAQSNLGLALVRQAEVATTEAERGELLAQAVDAFRAALGASAPGTNDWASRQYNLAVLYVTRAGGAADEAAACADLGAALACVDLADGVFAQGIPLYHEYAVNLRQRIEEAMAEGGCGG